MMMLRNDDTLRVTMIALRASFFEFAHTNV